MTFSTSSHSVPLPHSNLYFSRNVKRPLPFLFSSCTAVFIFFVYVLSSHMECGTINPIFKWGSLLLLVPNVPNPVLWNKLIFKKCIVLSVRGWFHYTDLYLDYQQFTLVVFYKALTVLQYLLSLVRCLICLWYLIKAQQMFVLRLSRYSFCWIVLDYTRIFALHPIFIFYINPLILRIPHRI